VKVPLPVSLFHFEFYEALPSRLQCWMRRSDADVRADAKIRRLEADNIRLALRRTKDNASGAGRLRRAIHPQLNDGYINHECNLVRDVARSGHIDRGMSDIRHD
jgi:hypothetical protein